MIVPPGEGLWAPFSSVAENQLGDERGQKKKGKRADAGNEHAVGPRQVDRSAVGPQQTDWGPRLKKTPERN